MYDLLLTHATIVNADEVVTGSVAVQSGKISGIFPDCHEAPTRETLDLTGKLVFPGLTDCHVHFNTPGYSHRETFACGTAAAAVGGIATILDMPMLNRPPVTDAETFVHKHALVQPDAATDFGFWGALVNHNFDRLQGLDTVGALAYKCFMCDPGDNYTRLTNEKIGLALEHLKPFDGLTGFHCEDEEMLSALQAEKMREKRFSRRDFLDAHPVAAELKAVQDVLALAKQRGARIHICHVSHPIVAQAVKQAKADGVRVTAETCPQYLVFSEDDLLEKGMLFKCTPPLRKKEDAEALWEYVIDGTIDCIGSDHSPAAPCEKTEEANGAFGAWGGLGGVQTTVQVLFDQIVHRRRQSPTLLAKLMGQGPARVFSVYGRKGAIAPGFDADFTIIDPEAAWQITEDSLLYRNPVSAFCGVSGQGLPVRTIIRGQTAAENGAILQRRGRLVTKQA
ncbi:MAG: allantoinase AllB [Intestinibacillus sp.]